MKQKSIRKSQRLEKKNLDIIPLEDIFSDFKRDKKEPHNLDKIISRHPFRLLICGPSGSGKSLFSISLLTRPEFLANFFHEIYFFSPSVHFESENELIKLKNTKTKVEFHETTDEFQNVIKMIQAKNNELKSKNKKMKKCLIIIDDFISNKRFMKSKKLTDCFILMRKYNTSIIFLTQYYKSMLPLMRVNCTGLVIFNQNKSEIEKLSDECGIAQYDKHFFFDVFKMIGKTNYSFMTINKNAKPDDRFYFCLHTKLTK